MTLIFYFICFLMVLVMLDYYAKKSADKAMEDELAIELHEAFGHLRDPISFELAQHEVEREAIAGLMVEDDPDLNDPYREEQ